LRPDHCLPTIEGIACAHHCDQFHLSAFEPVEQASVIRQKAHHACKAGTVSLPLNVQVRIWLVLERPFSYNEAERMAPMTDQNLMKSHDTLYQAVVARDYRFDGKFFVAVKTTGVYCRPICPARPKRENVEFFKTAQAAERAGYRPCLRCRPEAAPGSPAWNGKHATVERALKLIAEGALEHQTDDAFAARLGITARYLRRLFEKEFGHTPKQLHDNARLNFARKLIVETHLPMTEIAFSAGFHSLRRFNDAVKRRFHRPPSGLRSLRKDAQPTSMIRLSLPYRPPFDWDSVLDYYRRHRISGIETIASDTYARVFTLGATNTIGFFQISAQGNKPELLLEIAISDTRQLLRAVQRIRHMFDLDSDPVLIANAFAQSNVLGSLQGRYHGVRVARGFDPFETAIATILGQGISVMHASGLMSQLVAAYGEVIRHPVSDEHVRVFPAPCVLAESDLRALHITRQKRATVREFSSRVLEGAIHLERAQDQEDFKSTIQTIKGIGSWSAEYIALRALGDTDAFPATDLVLQRFMNANRHFDPEAMKPWRSYLAVCLWKEFAHVSKQERKNGYAIVQTHELSGRPTQAGCGGRESYRGALAQRLPASHQAGRDARRCPAPRPR
jgi:AraC family transcriptional regulator of adaptative response / DNA-3-methyladenine glycosylase II